MRYVLAVAILLALGAACGDDDASNSEPTVAPQATATPQTTTTATPTPTATASPPPVPAAGVPDLANAAALADLGEDIERRFEILLQGTPEEVYRLQTEACRSATSLTEFAEGLDATRAFIAAFYGGRGGALFETLANEARVTELEVVAQNRALATVRYAVVREASSSSLLLALDEYELVYEDGVWLDPDCLEPSSFGFDE